jgi:hypothetical protein
MSNANNNERLNYIKDWYSKQQEVVVELPPVVTMVGNMKKNYRFSGYRLGDKVLFRDGKATINRDDLHKLLAMYPNLIVHENTTNGKDGAK